ALSPCALMAFSITFWGSSSARTFAASRRQAAAERERNVRMIASSDRGKELFAIVCHAFAARSKHGYSRRHGRPRKHDTHLGQLWLCKQAVVELVEHLVVGDLGFDELLAVAQDVDLERAFDAVHLFVIAEAGLLLEFLAPHRVLGLALGCEQHSGFLVEE